MSAEKGSGHVLVVHSDAFECFADVTVPAKQMELHEVLDKVFVAKWLSVQPRASAEGDRNFRQIIPYILVMNEGRLLCYRRGVKGSENRLYGLRSIGWGGHVERADLQQRGTFLDVRSTIRATAKRELAEELGLSEPLDRQYLGLIVERDGDVGLVHVACVEVWTVSRNSYIGLEDTSEDVEWHTLEEVAQNNHELESWSLHALKLLNALEERG
jgi:predicted NUDIX family phosphoesterase